MSVSPATDILARPDLDLAHRGECCEFVLTEQELRARRSELRLDVDGQPCGGLHRTEPFAERRLSARVTRIDSMPATFTAPKLQAA